MKDRKKDNHGKVKLALKISGGVILLVGIVLAIIAFVNFFSVATSESGGMPDKFYLFFIGIPCIGIGAGCLIFGFRGELLTCAKREAMPVIKEAIEEIDEKEEGKVCPRCGKVNDKEDNFCSSCGEKLE